MLQKQISEKWQINCQGEKLSWNTEMFVKVKTIEHVYPMN